MHGLASLDKPLPATHKGCMQPSIVSPCTMHKSSPVCPPSGNLSRAHARWPVEIALYHHSSWLEHGMNEHWLQRGQCRISSQVSLLDTSQHHTNFSGLEQVEKHMSGESL